MRVNDIYDGGSAARYLPSYLKPAMLGRNRLVNASTLMREEKKKFGISEGQIECGMVVWWEGKGRRRQFKTTKGFDLVGCADRDGEGVVGIKSEGNHKSSLEENPVKFCGEVLMLIDRRG